MNTSAAQLCAIISQVKPALGQMSSQKAGIKPAPQVWSKKEILGHLIDSAANNHQRFVRGAQNLAADFPPYNQNRWVEVQHYNDMNWSDIVELFCQLNLHLCRVLAVLPEECLQNPCNIGKEQPVPMQLIITDYLRHLKHHLSKILDTPVE